MRRIVLLVLALAVVPAALAAGARDRQVAGPVSAVAVAGTEVAYADEYRTGCHELRLWDVADRSDRRLASHCFVQTSTGSGVAGVIATGGRALWLTYTGGNIREWSLWTKGLGGRPKRISFLAADVDGPPPVVLGRVWEGSLPYAIGRTVIVLAPNGSRKFTLTAPDRVVALSAHSRGYAAVLASGSVLTISLAGKVLREFPFEPGFVQEAVLAAPGLVVKTVNGLEIRNGDSTREIALPRSARFLGLSEGIVAYGTGRQLRLKRLTGGHDTLFRTLAPRFQAQLGRRGLVYASGRTLGFTVWAFVSSSV
jgi:hypothetical protein